MAYQMHTLNCGSFTWYFVTSSTSIPTSNTDIFIQTYNSFDLAIEGICSLFNIDKQKFLYLPGVSKSFSSNPDISSISQVGVPPSSVALVENQPVIPVGTSTTTVETESVEYYNGIARSPAGSQYIPYYRCEYHDYIRDVYSGTRVLLIRMHTMIMNSSAISDGKFLFNNLTSVPRRITISIYGGSSGTRVEITIYGAENLIGTNLTTVKNGLSWFNGFELDEHSESSDDPYTTVTGDTSTTGGGNGTGDFVGDTISESSIPTVTALNSGFITAYSPTVAQLNALATYMWTSDFATNLKKLFGDTPISTIIGLGAVPVSPSVGSSQHVILGNIDTEISMPVITNQYVKFDCGSIQISPKYGAFLDYEPYTSIDLYLPYIGMVQLSTNDVMGKSLSVKYIIDVISGACVAEVLCGGSVYYTFEGCCLSQFPISQNDYSNVFHAAVQAATSLTGGIAGAVAGGFTGNVAGAVNSAVQGIGGAAQAAMNAHPVVNRSGGLAGAGGMLTIQKPFIVMSTPKMVTSNAQNSFIGYPIFATYRLSDLSGYTEIENINVSGLYATQTEQDEIKMLLKNGVIL